MRAWLAGRPDATVDVRTDLGNGIPDEAADDVEVFPVALLFRGPDEFHAVEAAAVAAAVGSVLDVGAGAGAVAVVLAGRGHAVTTVEPVPVLVEVLRDRGVADVRPGSLADLAPGERFDTVLSLMNGAGLAGTRAGLSPFLGALAERVAPGGRILLDSTDPAGWPEPDDGRLPGEVHLQLGFDGAWGDPLPWLYVGPEDLLAEARSLGLAGRLVERTDDDRYLVELVPPTL